MTGRRKTIYKTARGLTIFLQRQLKLKLMTAPSQRYCKLSHGCSRYAVTEWDACVANAVRKFNAQVTGAVVSSGEHGQSDAERMGIAITGAYANILSACLSSGFGASKAPWSMNFTKRPVSPRRERNISGWETGRM